MKVFLVYDENLLTIAPSWPALEAQVLTFVEKTLEQPTIEQEVQNVDGSTTAITVPTFGESVIARTPVQMFHVLKDDQTHGRVVQTWQGLRRRVALWLREQGHEVQVVDQRKPFPHPRLDLMRGFRFSQRELLTRLLTAGQSGLLGAPTRFGKTILLVNTLRAYPSTPTVVTVPGRDMVQQLYEAVKTGVPEREVKMMGAGSRVKFSSDEITVCSMDSLHKIDHGRIRLLLVDEPHALPTDARMEDFNLFPLCRKLGFGATLSGRFDGRDALIEGLIGPVLVERTYQEAVAEGAICQIKVIMIEVPFMPPTHLRARARVMETLLFQNPSIASLTKWICRELLPHDWQTLLFINNEDHAEYMLKAVGEEGTVAMAKLLGVKERRALTARMVSGEIKRCLASNIYAQGVTFSDVRAMVNLSGGGPYTGTVQKPGRLAEIRPGKRCGVLFDFMLEPVGSDRKARGRWDELKGGCVQRLAVYKDKGYDVHHFKYDEREEMRRYFEAECV